MKRNILLILLLLLFSCASTLKIHELSETQLMNMQDVDLHSLKICRNGLLRTLEFIRSEPDIFPQEKASKAKFLNKEQREISLKVWQRIMDYYFTMDSISSLYQEFMLVKNSSLRSTSYNIVRYSFFIEYRFALQYLSIFENNPQLDILLNEKIPGLTEKENLYDTYKQRFLNVDAVTRFASFQSSSKLFPCEIKWLNANVKKDTKIILNLKKHKGPVLTAKNGLEIIKETNERFWFPVQKGVSTWMGDTKVYRSHEYLISESQIENIKNVVRPGDVLLERREWYLSNAGLPGFWTHSAFYLGTDKELDEYFSTEAVKKEFNLENEKSFSSYLKERFPVKYAIYDKLNKQSEQHRVIEAISEGVVFTSLEYSAHCDSVAVLRPAFLSRVEKAYAVIAVFEYHGRPYDFNFDFNSDSELVCTELVYKAYEKTANSSGIKFPLKTVLGRKILSANDIAEMYYLERVNGDSQFQFIIFYDGDEIRKRSILANEIVFVESHKRPKWHVLK